MLRRLKQWLSILDMIPSHLKKLKYKHPVYRFRRWDDNLLWYFTLLHSIKSKWELLNIVHIKKRKWGPIYGSFILSSRRGGKFANDKVSILIIEDRANVDPRIAMFTLSHEFGHFIDYLHTITHPRYAADRARTNYDDYINKKLNPIFLPHPDDAKSLYDSEVAAWKHGEDSLRDIGWTDWHSFRADADNCLGSYWNIYMQCSDVRPNSN